MRKFTLFSVFVVLFFSCEKVERSSSTPEENVVAVSSREVAKILSNLPIGQEQMQEVFDAVSSSSANGYDEEYTLQGLFSSPGCGVGDNVSKASSKVYTNPLKDMISAYLAGSGTKSSSGISIRDLEDSGLQIYWPWFDKWDGSAYPAITFDPADGSPANFAYQLERDSSGSLKVREIVVDEEYAASHPVWVVNSNDDASYTSLELLRRREENPGGGEIIIGKRAVRVKDVDSEVKTLLIKDFKAVKNFDSWLAGGSEFFVKFASVENFKAVTDEEMMLYNPSVTDFMISVKRKEVGSVKSINAVVVDAWTDQLSRCAFLLVEDDGGTWTTWDAQLELKIFSKTYGLNISIPFRSRDDIVWRGTLSSSFLEKGGGKAYRYGDAEITFEFLNL